jgi:hypothetical protein
MATLIFSECQAGKTAKVLDVIKHSVGTCTLTIVLTQANSKLSVEQFIQRAKAADVATYIYNTNDIGLETLLHPVGHTMIVGFHHKKHENKQISFLRATKQRWSNVILVVDEADEGGLGGVENRLEYVSRVEDACGRGVPLRLILITATIANLSKQIMKISEDTPTTTNGIVHKILHTPCVECVFATPPPTYIGYKWFVDNAWVPLELPKRPKGFKHDEYIRLVEQCVVDKFCAVEDSYKELSLISVSHKINDHGRLGTQLLDAGFNVSIPYNAKHQDAIEVYYKSSITGNTKLWLLPYNKLLHCNYTHSHILQAAVFMNTNAEARIKESCVPEEFARLEQLAAKMTAARPKDFPNIPRLALIAGRKAGRGITFQNPGIDFVCTSFCFAHVKDTTQRGAINTQKLGRAFGALDGLVTRPGRQPLLIATKQLLVDAGANRDTLDIPTELVSLKDLVPTDVYMSHHVKNRCNIDAKLAVLNPVEIDDEDGVIDGVHLKKLRNWICDESLLVGVMLRYLVASDSSVTFEQFKKGINYTGTDDGFESNIKNGVGVKSTYGKLWTYKSKKIYLNPKLQPYIQN